MIILASTSESRRRIFSAAGVTFTAAKPAVDEEQVKQSNRHLPPRELALLLAREKASSLREAYQEGLIIGCDQVLSCGTRLFDKAQTMEEALENLRFLAGRTHILHTALCCLEPLQPVVNIVSEPNLKMRALSDLELRHYLEAAGPAILGSVGCYHIEGLGIRLFDSIDGDLFSIQGLPLLPLLAHLRTRGFIT